MSTPTLFWQSLEQVPGLSTSAIEWRSLLGLDWDWAQHLLRPTDEDAETVLIDGEPHRVVRHESGRIVGIPLEGGVAKDLSRADAAVIEIHRGRLVGLLVTALDLIRAGEPRGKGEIFSNIGGLAASRSTTCTVHLCAHGDPSIRDAAIRRLLVESDVPIVVLTPSALVDQDILQIVRLRNGCHLSLIDSIELDPGGRAVKTAHAERVLTDFRRRVEQWETGERRVDPFKFAKTGRVWVLAFNGAPAFVPHRDASGLAHIQHLLARPHQPIPVEQLEKMVTGNSALDAVSCGDQVVDRTALAQVWAKLQDLNGEFERAQRDDDEAAQDRIRRERDDLNERVRLIHGLNDRVRRVGDDAERLRSKVSKAIARTIEVLADELPDLATHLDNAIDRGRTMTYRPDGRIDWSF